MRADFAARSAIAARLASSVAARVAVAYWYFYGPSADGA
jgi:hypothetical protein